MFAFLTSVALVVVFVIGLITVCNFVGGALINLYYAYARPQATFLSPERRAQIVTEALRRVREQ